MRLELQEISCGYSRHTVVEEVSFNISSGEIMCLLGPNGSGKTTLFKSLLGLLPPRQGSILLGGEDIRSWSRERLAQIIGYIPQSHVPPFPFKVLDVVLMGRTPHLGPLSSPGPRDRAIARKALATLGISHLEERPYTEISGGERQLALIARALTQEPKVLVMDEPTTALDFGNQLLVLSHIKGLAEMGLAIIMATHFPDHALLYGSKVLMLKEGRVYHHGPPEEVITEASLRSLYGVEARILRVSFDGGKEIRVCLPLASEKT